MLECSGSCSYKVAQGTTQRARIRARNARIGRIYMQELDDEAEEW